MTTLLPPSEVDMLRSLKGAAVFLLVMLRLDRVYPGRSFQPEQIASILDVDVRTVTKYMQSLSARNRVLLTASGYVLTEGGRAMFLSATENELALSPGETQAQSRSDAGTSPDIKTGTDQTPFSPGTGTRAQAQADNTNCVIEANFADIPAHNVCLRDSEEDSLINLNIKESSESESRAQNVQPLKARLILEKTAMVFGKVVMAPREIEELDARVVLGWVAQAYAQRQTPKNPGGLYAPWGLVYRRLCEGKQPRAEYRIAPADYLPAEYLKAIGYPVSSEQLSVTSDQVPVDSEQDAPEAQDGGVQGGYSLGGWLG